MNLDTTLTRLKSDRSATATSSAVSVRRESQQSIELLSNFPSEGELLVRYSPQNSAMALRDPRVIYTGKSPCLGLVELTYGRGAGQRWLLLHLADLNECCGVKERMSERQLSLLTSTILQLYGHLKLTELMCFFRDFIAGSVCEGDRPLRFYGTADPATLLVALKVWIRQRNVNAEKYRLEAQRRAEEEERARHEAESVNWEEYARSRGIDPEAMSNPLNYQPLNGKTEKL